MTGAQLISRSLRLIGKLGEGETATGQAAEDARLFLNDMLDQWQAESLLVETEKEDTVTLAASTSSYSIGDGATWDLVRPTHIIRALVIPDSGASNPIQIPIRVVTPQGWAAIRAKSTTASYPYLIYYDKRMDSSSSGTVFVYPVTTNTSAQIVLWTPEILNSFTDLTTNYTFPPGYAMALRTNLAVFLTNEYGMPTPPSLTTQAGEAKDVLERINTADDAMVIDGALLGGYTGGYNVLTD